VSATSGGALLDNGRARATWGRIRWAFRQRFVLDRSQLPELDLGNDRKLRWYARTRRGRWVAVSVADAIQLAGTHEGMVILRTRQAVERGEAGPDVMIVLDAIEPAIVQAARLLLASMGDDLRSARESAEALMHYVPHPPTGDESDPTFAKVVYELHRQIDRAATLASSYRDTLDGARSVLDPPH
jgi:hypothetical protein